MANTSTYTILCVFQLCIGLLMFSFGIADRTAIQVPASFMMLPIFIGVLVGIAGFCGILIGHQNKRQGYADINRGTAIKVINLICTGLSFMAFYMYGTTVSYFGLQDAYNTAIEDLPYDEQDKHSKLPLPKIPIDVLTDVSTIQGILSVIVILSLAEMFVGCWLVLMDRSHMVFGTSPQQDRVPLFASGASPSYQQPAQQATQGIPQQQPQVYVMPQGQNVPGRQVYVPTNQAGQPPLSQHAPTVMVVPNNQSMAPSNQNAVPNVQDMTIHNPVQSGESHGDSFGTTQQPRENQADGEWQGKYSDTNQLI